MRISSTSSIVESAGAVFGSPANCISMSSAVSIVGDSGCGVGVVVGGVVVVAPTVIVVIVVVVGGVVTGGVVVVTSTVVVRGVSSCGNVPQFGQAPFTPPG
jgi:hypothetical protein